MVLEECTFNLVCHDRKCQMIPVCNCECKVSECKVSPIVHVSHDRKWYLMGEFIITAILHVNKQEFKSLLYHEKKVQWRQGKLNI